MAKKRIYIRVILVVIFIVIFTYCLLGEKVAKNDGIGWDGLNYLNTIQNFTELIITKGYDKYSIQRIMPWGAVNILFKICNIETTPFNALIAGSVVNIIALTLSIFYFFSISSFKRWKISTEIIAFSSLFYSYPILKVSGYIILQSDIVGFLWGIMLLYYFIKEKPFALFLISILGAVHWPTVALVSGLALLFLPKQSINIETTLKGTDSIIYNTFLYGISLLPIFYQILCVITPPNHTVTQFQYDGRPQTHILYFIISVFCISIYWFYLIKPLRLSFSKICLNFNLKKFFINLTLLIAIYVICMYILNMFTNGNVGSLSILGLIQKSLISGAIDPFNFIESFFVYYGLIVLLVILLWYKSIKFIVNKGIGFLFVIALALLFAVFPEARVSIMFLPFIVLPTIEYIDTVQLKRWVAPCYVIFSIVLSHFWFPINVPGMETAFKEETFSNLSIFPAQRYFMCSGVWQSHEMYAVFMVITIIIGVLLYTGLKKKWFINE